MAPEPNVALFKTASGSLPHRKILADFLQCIAKQRIAPKCLPKLSLVSFSVVIQSINQSINRSIDRSIVQSITQSKERVHSMWKY